MESEIKKVRIGSNIQFDNKEFVPMLDSKGNERIGSRGPLVKYGYKTRNAKVLYVRGEKVEVRIEGRQYDQWLKHSELRNLRVLD